MGVGVALSMGETDLRHHRLVGGIEIAGDVGIGMLVDDDGGGSVRHEHVAQAAAIPVDGGGHLARDVDHLPAGAASYLDVHGVLQAAWCTSRYASLR